MPSRLLATALVLLAACTPRDRDALQTEYEVPSWAEPPNVTGVAADLNGRWERFQPDEPATELWIHSGALQELGRNSMDRGSLLRAFGMPSNTPLEFFANHFESDVGIYAIAWDHLERGSSKLQYAIRAVVDVDGYLWLAFTKNEQKDRESPFVEDSWLWRCRRR